MKGLGPQAKTST
jgi:hypothetical protein